jgi:hypothetical protein
MVPDAPVVTPEVSTVKPGTDPREVALDKMLSPNRRFVSGVSGVALRTKNEDLILDGVPGSFASAYAFITVLFYNDFPDAKAPVRTTDRTPKLLVAFDGSIRGRLFLVKAKVNRGKNTRSVKVGSSGYGSVSSMTSPDQDWVIACRTKEVKPGIWEFAPNAPLEPGEYGIFASIQGGGRGVGGGELFDFGID